MVDYSSQYQCPTDASFSDGCVFKVLDLKVSLGLFILLVSIS